MAKTIALLVLCENSSQEFCRSGLRGNRSRQDGQNVTLTRSEKPLMDKLAPVPATVCRLTPLFLAGLISSWIPRGPSARRESDRCFQNRVASCGYILFRPVHFNVRDKSVSDKLSTIGKTIPFRADTDISSIDREIQRLARRAASGLTDESSALLNLQRDQKILGSAASPRTRENENRTRIAWTVSQFDQVWSAFIPGLRLFPCSKGGVIQSGPPRFSFPFFV